MTSDEITKLSFALSRELKTWAEEVAASTAQVVAIDYLNNKIEAQVREAVDTAIRGYLENRISIRIKIETDEQM